MIHSVQQHTILYPCSHGVSLIEIVYPRTHFVAQLTISYSHNHYSLLTHNNIYILKVTVYHALLFYIPSVTVPQYYILVLTPYHTVKFHNRKVAGYNSMLLVILSVTLYLIIMYHKCCILLLTLSHTLQLHILVLTLYYTLQLYIFKVTPYNSFQFNLIVL